MRVEVVKVVRMPCRWPTTHTATFSVSVPRGWMTRVLLKCMQSLAVGIKTCNEPVALKLGRTTIDCSCAEGALEHPSPAMISVSYACPDAAHVRDVHQVVHRAISRARVAYGGEVAEN